MRTTNSGRFTIVLGGEEKEVVVSLGLKAELYKLISKAQLTMAQAEQRVYMSQEMAEKIQEADKAVKDLEEAQASQDEIDLAKAALDLLYKEAMEEIEEKQRKVLEETIFGRIDLTERIFADAISCLLSERDQYGKITKKIEPEEIMWSPLYGEAQDELAELLYSVTEYITSALKKISAISELVNNVSRSQEEKNPL